MKTLLHFRYKITYQVYRTNRWVNRYQELDTDVEDNVHVINLFLESNNFQEEIKIVEVKQIRVWVPR